LYKTKSNTQEESVELYILKEIYTRNFYIGLSDNKLCPFFY